MAQRPLSVFSPKIGLAFHRAPPFFNFQLKKHPKRRGRKIIQSDDGAIPLVRLNKKRKKIHWCFGFLPFLRTFILFKSFNAIACTGSRSFPVLRYFSAAFIEMSKPGNRSVGSPAASLKTLRAATGSYSLLLSYISLYKDSRCNLHIPRRFPLIRIRSCLPAFAALPSSVPPKIRPAA